MAKGELFSGHLPIIAKARLEQLALACYTDRISRRLLSFSTPSRQCVTRVNACLVAASLADLRMWTTRGKVKRWYSSWFPMRLADGKHTLGWRRHAANPRFGLAWVGVPRSTPPARSGLADLVDALGH